MRRIGTRFSPWAALGILLSGPGFTQQRPDESSVATPQRRGGMPLFIDQRISVPKLGPDQSATQITVPGARLVRLQLRVEGEVEGRVEVALEGSGGWWQAIPIATIQAAGTLTTPSIPGESVKVYLLAGDGARAFVRIDRAYYERPLGPQLQTIFDRADWAATYKYFDTPGFAQASRPVALVRFTLSDGAYSCSGFLVSENRLLTNAHCFSDLETCRSAEIVFGFEYDSAGRALSGETYSCIAIHRPVMNLDLVALQLAGSPGARWGVVRVADGDPIASQPAWLISHPAGQPKMASRVDCKVSSIPLYGDTTVPEFFGHTCDTDRGSSGGAVFNDAFELIGLHRHGFDPSWDPQWRENSALRLSVIRELATTP